MRDLLFCSNRPLLVLLLLVLLLLSSGRPLYSNNPPVLLSRLSRGSLVTEGSVKNVVT